MDEKANQALLVSLLGYAGVECDCASSLERPGAEVATASGTSLTTC